MRSNPAAAEPLFELKFGQVGIANLRLRECDPAALQTELAVKVAAASQLFGRAPLVLDLGHLAQLPDAEAVQALLDAIRAAGMLPVGLAYGTTENEQLAQMLQLPLFAKFRNAYERTAAADTAPRSPDPVKGQPAQAPDPILVGMRHDKPVRSGQQVYARGRDLILAATVGNGAEVIADGSIHVYGRLSGRALAGAQGDTSARIYCMDFQAELVSIAGQYRVFEEFPAELRGKPAQAWLQGDKLLLAKL
jgi:septum site-determining protein MinC